MAKEICISSTPHETRLAILEDDQLAEIYYERENEYTLAGSIYNGRVTRVLPGMQSAFVDLGLERDAFLYVTDFLEMEDPEDSDEVEKAAATGGNQAPREVRGSGERSTGERGSGERGQRSEGRREGVGERGEQERGQDRSQDRAQERGQERRGRGGRPQQEPTHPVEMAEVEAAHVPSAPGYAETEADEGDEQGAKRWRGRRRRRGGRGPAAPVSDPVETEASAETYAETGVDSSSHAETEVATELQAASGESRGSFSQSAEAPAAERGFRSREPRAEREQVPFLLPGESLSKYGGEPAAATTAAPAKPRPAMTFKPSSLIDTPIEWDGSGLLPGESLARHRSRSEESPTHSLVAEPEGTFADADEPRSASIEYEETTEEAFETGGTYEHAGSETIESAYVTPDEQPLSRGELGADDLVEEDLVREEMPEEPLLGESAKSLAGAESSDPFADPFFTDPHETGTRHEAAHDAVSESYQQEEHSGQQHGSPVGEDVIGHAPIEEPSTEVVADALNVQTGDPDKPEDARGTEPEVDRSASHHVDPLPPSEFRLFGLGGKKKKSDDSSMDEYPSAVATPVSDETPASAGTARGVSASSYAPGSGLVEEETIEEEEFDAPRGHQHKSADEHDLDDYEEEEKIQTQIRSGGLGEMLQEAHLDHRIQLNFDDKAADGEVDDDFDIEEEDEEAEGQPIAEGAPAEPGQQRRDRNGRGRRGGRGAQGGGNGRGGDRRGPSRRSAQTSDLPIISDLLKPGQEILVQIAKEPIAKKGARITSHIALPGRFLVFMPTVSHVGVSRKIASDEERQRLKRILISERGEASGGFIVRTAAEGASEEELRADLRFLLHLWDEIKQRSENSKSPALIYHDLSLIERILRDQVSANFSSIWVDSEQDYERIVRFLNRFSPNLVRRVKLYTKETPLFEHFGIQDEISKALRSKVWLKSGGSIVINQTEALVAIDINTGKYVGKTARLEDTIVKTNLDAIPEIVRQIRLRDLGGIIIIDFIDMDERKNRFKVMAALEEALKNDRAPTKVLQFNDFGLVAITRKRVKQSLERTLSVPCPTCQATGMVKSPATVCNEIYIELRKMRKHFENADVLLRVNPETVKVLKANNARWLTEFEELIGKNILVKSDAALHPEQFDIQG